MANRLVALCLVLATGTGSALAQISSPLPSGAPTQVPLSSTIPEDYDNRASAAAIGESPWQARKPTTLVDYLQNKPLDNQDAMSACWWIRPDVLLWWTKRDSVNVPLVSTGALDLVGSSPLFGDSRLNYGQFVGGRLTAGLWVDPYHVFAFEASGFLLQQKKTTDNFNSATDFPSLGIPYQNADTGAPAFISVATPGVSTGSVGVSSTSQFWGGESNFLVNFVRDGSFSLDFLTGFRYLGLREDLQIGTTSSLLPGNTLLYAGHLYSAPATVTTTDRILSRSDFYGGQLGVRLQWVCADFFLNVVAKIAVGDSHEVNGVSGSSALYTTSAAPIQILQNGMFAYPSNLGHYTNDECAVVPELEIKLGYRLTSHMSIFAGYNLLYWSRVIQPGQQLNTLINPEVIPTNIAYGNPITQYYAQPVQIHAGTDYWAQGISGGLEFQF